MDNLDYKKDKADWHKYGVRKAGNWYHATEFAKLHKADGITSFVCLIACYEGIQVADNVSRHPIRQSKDRFAAPCSGLAK